ncbi:serine-type D-Ala-D-Ala carboxypeptidase [Pasteurellaceae bacterium 15-036681]|nr:serine-type D-Ala-D-Ala carboxypeptidase [Pasteurellaceae bacterium 15-036681]
MQNLIKQTKTTLFCSLFFTFSSHANIDISMYLPNLPTGTSVSVIAKNLDTNQIIADYRSQEFMLPASTQKVFTALAAKLVLPEDFRFQTALLANGEVKDNVLNGDLIAKFTGDPTLTSGQLSQLISQLKQQGINQINGNLIIDTSVFASHDKASGWVWNDLTICFSAPPAAVNIDHNCFYSNLDANKKVGELVSVETPSVYPVEVVSSAYITDKDEAGYCQLDAEVSHDNYYHIKGCLARQDKPFGLSFAIQDPTNYGAKIIANNLSKVGIELKGQITVATKPQDGKILAEHYSAYLADLLKKMMKKSDNQIADSLFRTIANRYHNRAASFPLASQTIRTVLKSKVGVDFTNSVIVDGSGLSRHNQVNAQTMLNALEVIAKNEESLHLLDTFPIAGVDGTISGRGSITKEPLAKNIIAKTGALKGVYNLAGFMKNAKGERIAFVQFISGYSTGELESKTKRAPLNQFENSLYMALYEEQ